MVIGGCMFPDSRGGVVSLMYLQLLLNIPRVSRYSWGSAVLSFLYRELCKSSIIGRKIICWPLLILQVWAWSRMTSLSPDVHGYCHIVPAAPDVNDNDYDTILQIAPYGARWARHFSHTHTSTHSFNWTVYNFEALDVQAFITGHQGEIWRCVCPLICFDIVEMYRPNRVLRQFGMRQRIPEPATDGDDLHNLSRVGHRNFDWKEFHSGPIEIWKNKETHIVEDMLVSGHMMVDYQYKKWYDNITIRSISPNSEGIGYSSGQAYFRAIVDEEATTLTNRFRGLSVHEQSREALEETIQDDWRIGSRLRDALNRVSNDEEVQHDIPRRNSFQNLEECSRRRRRESGSSSSSGSQQHRRPHGFDVTATSHGHCMCGSSRGHDMSGTSHRPSTVSNVDYRPSMQYGFHTPYVANSVSFTDLLNSDHRQFDDEVRSFNHEVRPNYLTSPFPFHGFSATSSANDPYGLNREHNTETEHNTDMEAEQLNLRRSLRVRIPRGCGTSHFYYY
ncbi:serine/threonine-protein phosphatase 7 long form homolog isoform X2 [Primulina eburnea]|uniref:serine/threonine-protein phosphatase 7 long form homolog isoform X2 n=1 Tax=Primulina eburnea TaxID=1245227 RepID=UPI003C6C8CD0